MNSENKMMPHDNNAERQVIGAIMHTPESIFIATELLERGDFYSDRHQIIYQALMDCYLKHDSIDLVTLSDHLREIGKLEQVGPTYCAEILLDVPTAANITKHSNIVRSKSVMRKAILWARGIQQQGYEGVPDVKQWVGSLESGLIEISETVREKRDPHISDILLSIRQEQEQLASGEIRPIACPLFRSISASQDSVIPGIFPKHFWLVAGYTSVGKSTVLAQLLCDAGQDGAKMLVFSCEDSRNMKATKMLANLSDVSQRKIITGRTAGYEARLRAAEQTLRSWGMIIYDDVYTIDELILKTKKHKMKNGINLVALDFVQNLQGPGSLYERMSDAAVKLQKMAKDLDIAVIILSQVNNDSVRDDSELIGVKGAGELAAAADIVLWLKREKGTDRGLNCEIKKNRPFGETGMKPLQFSEFYTRLEQRM